MANDEVKARFVAFGFVVLSPSGRISLTLKRLFVFTFSFSVRFTNISIATVL